jgi:glycosyltransferase domain-containing protein
LDKVALLLFTYNRSSFVKRALRFYARELKDHRIYVSDASTEPGERESNEKESREEGVAEYRYAMGCSFTQRLEELLSLVTQPYVHIIADDDFVSPAWLPLAIESLEKEFDVVTGYELSFSVSREQAFGEFTKNGLIKPNPKEPFLEGKTPSSRMKSLSKQDWPTVGWYALQKVGLLNLFLELSKKYELNDFSLESFYIFNQTLHGRLQKLPTISLFRQAMNTNRTPYKLSPRLSEIIQFFQACLDSLNRLDSDYLSPELIKYIHEALYRQIAALYVNEYGHFNRYTRTEILLDFLKKRAGYIFRSNLLNYYDHSLAGPPCPRNIERAYNEIINYCTEADNINFG